MLGLTIQGNRQFELAKKGKDGLEGLTMEMNGMKISVVYPLLLALLILAAAVPVTSCGDDAAPPPRSGGTPREIEGTRTALFAAG